MVVTNVFGFYATFSLLQKAMPADHADFFLICMLHVPSGGLQERQKTTY